MASSFKFKVHKVKPYGAGEPTPHVDSAADAEALLSFLEEESGKPALETVGPDRPGKGPRPAGPARIGALLPVRRAYAVGASVVAAVIIGAVVYWNIPQSTPAAASLPPIAAGTAAIDSKPSGADVRIDGVARGKTPLKLTLSAGQHLLEVALDGTTRSMPLQLEAGGLVSHYLEMTPAPAAAVVPTGRLSVTSDPPGARVTVDGTPRGVTPLVLPPLAPGQYTVAISNGATVTTRRVTMTAGESTSVFASLAASAAAGGWAAFNAPIDLEIFEDGRLVGTTATDRLMLPAGRHELELVNTTYEFRRVVPVRIEPGSVSTVPVAIPNGSVSVNAVPWAEVWIDGRSYGTTPLGNLSVPIGPREIVWRHPQLGERRRTVAVTASSPVRLGMDFSQ